MMDCGSRCQPFDLFVVFANVQRSPQGAELTPSGEVLLRCGINIFDELRQGYRSLENLSDPNSGEVRLGCTEIIVHSLASTVVRKFSAKYPGVLVRCEARQSGRTSAPRIEGAQDRSPDHAYDGSVSLRRPAFRAAVRRALRFRHRRRKRVCAPAPGGAGRHHRLQMGLAGARQRARRAYRRRRRLSAAQGSRQDALDRANDVVGGERRICRHSSDIRREVESGSGLLAGPARQIGGPADFRRARICDSAGSFHSKARRLG